MNLQASIFKMSVRRKDQHHNKECGGYPGWGDNTDPNEWSNAVLYTLKPKQTYLGGTWEKFDNLDMCGQGDVEIIEGWKGKYKVEDLQRMCEEKQYSGFSIGEFDHAALKKFKYQLKKSHCAPTSGYTNEFYLYTAPEGFAFDSENKHNAEWDYVP